MFRRLIFFIILVFAACAASFGQASAIRDYVGMISQTFHPDIISFMEELKSELEKTGSSAAAKSIDIYLKGESGTGFVYISGDGTNYIVTNYHVISHAHSLSVTFEKPDGEKTVFSGLSIIAADEEMDIALLAFAGGSNPFRQSLALYSRPLQEGDDVYSAGFPGLGTTLIWQLGRGMVSNASVRLPDNNNPDKLRGPFIQHTAQIDPGNSGGPLLVQTQGVPTGFAIAGINTLSARYRQAANFSIPIDRLQSFLERALNPQPVDSLSQLNERIASFIEAVNANKPIYANIAPYLSNDCTGENAQYAMSEIFSKAPRSVQNEIVQSFAGSPAEGMSYAVAWTIENAIRPRTGTINITANSVTADGEGKYTVSFNVNGKTIDSQWANEYGIWRIRTFGDFAAGDKSLAGNNRQYRYISGGRLITAPFLRFSGNIGYLYEVGILLGSDFKLSLGSKYTAAGFQGFIGAGYSQIEALFGLCLPIEIKKAAFIPFVDAGAGTMILSEQPGKKLIPSSLEWGFSVKGGLMFTTAALPGLYLQASYQRNFYKNDDKFIYPNIVFLGIGLAL